MWIWILIGILVFNLVFIWGLVAGTRRDNSDLEAQEQAIKEWKEKHGH